MSQKENIIQPTETTDDVQLDNTLRPQKLCDYIGQKEVKDNLEIFMQAALGRKEPLEHILIYGPPGLGKTTLAHIIAHEMGVNIHTTSGPAIERTGDMAAILTSLENGDVLFIDEIHRLNRQIEEVLYPAMEDFALDLVIGKGPSARTLRLDLPRFTLVGATTRFASLSSPLRDRFGMVHRLDFYQPEDIAQIITRSSKILKVPVDPHGKKIIAERARRTPRIANRLLKRVRDFAQVKSDGTITGDIAEEALNCLRIDCLGLDETDRAVLRTIIEKFKGGPVGVDTIAAATAEERETIEDVYEPYLLQMGLLVRSARGRHVTDLAYNHLGLTAPQKLL